MEEQENKSLAEYIFGKRKVRVIVIDGNPWFAASDVCKILEHTNARRAVAVLDEDEKIMLTKNDCTDFDRNSLLRSKKKGGAQKLNFINESGLYNLIFRSTLPEAKRFKKWVTSEVLPAIRKQGYYALQEQLWDVQHEYEEQCFEVERLENEIAELYRQKEDPKEAAKRELRRYIMHRMVSADIHHYEDGEREYYIYANNEPYVCTKEEFIAQVSSLFPEAKIKKVRGHWQFWGLATIISRKKSPDPIEDGTFKKIQEALKVK